jgi:hypothetical protein
VLAAAGVALSGTGGVNLLPNGGLKTTGGLLGVDSGITSLVGHQHVSADIVDLNFSVQTLLRSNFVATPTVTPSGTGPFGFAVKLAAGGALVAGNGGIGVDLGSAHTQAAYGDHTHALLHSPVTLGALSSLSGTVSGQQVTLEVRPVTGGGLLVTPSGVAVDFAVVARAGSISSGTGLSVANTATVLLGIAGNVLSGTVPLDANPPGGTGGLLVAGANGLRVALGATGTTAAAGNHTHNVVTNVTAGFMSASDKIRLDALAAAALPAPLLNFSREHLLVPGEHLTGLYRVPRPVTLLAAEACAVAPSGVTVLGLEVDGTLTGQTLALPAGPPNVEVTSSVSLSGTVLAGQLIRWRIVAGPAPPGAATQCSLLLTVN